MLAAVDKFVASGRTPDAYAEMYQAALELRAGMDRAVAENTELKLMVLALAPVQSVHARSAHEQTEALAITVWPTLLAPAFETDGPQDKHDPRASGMLPAPDEAPGAYLVRLCGSTLVSDCKQVVPELQGPVVGAIAVRRATERVRNAVAECVMCGADPGWQKVVRDWEAMDRMTGAVLADLKRRGDPDNWPDAGAAGEADPGLPEAEISDAGEVVIGGQRYVGRQRVAALRDLRGDNPAIALHLRPDMSLAQVRALLGDVRKSGAARVGVVARAPHYPWGRKLYWIAEGTGTQTDLRPTDSLQHLLRAVDAIAGPGTIARVD